MTIIELNIAGLQVTRSGSDFSREALKRSWQRNCRGLRRNLRPRPTSERPAA